MNIKLNCFTNKKLLAFAAVIFFGVLFRAILIWAYKIPVFAPDSSAYIELASHIVKGKILEYPGWRTPGYPLLLLITFGKFYIVEIFIQFIFDILVSYVLFDLIQKVSPGISVIVSFFYFTLVKVVLYEFNILTETATIFILTLTIWLTVRFEVVKIKASYKIILYTSLAITFCFLVRPMFIYVSPVLAFFMAFNVKKELFKVHLAKIMIVLFLPFSAYLGWNTLNYINHNWFTVTTFSGINLSQATVKFFHKAGEEHKLIRDIYQKHIDDSKAILDGTFVYQNKENDKAFQRMALNKDFEAIEALSIWRAYEELLDSTKLTGPQLSHQLSIISKELILKYPELYYKQVIETWVSFWDHADIPINREYTKDHKIVDVYMGLLKYQKYVLVFINILLIPVAFMILWKSIKQKNIFNTHMFLLALVVLASVLQAIVTFGGSSRFFFPFIPLVLFLVINTSLDILAVSKTSRVHN